MIEPLQAVSFVMTLGLILLSVLAAVSVPWALSQDRSTEARMAVVFLVWMESLMLTLLALVVS